MEKLHDRFLRECGYTYYSMSDMKKGCDIAFDILLQELAKLVRRHGPGDCVDFSHVTALMDQILGEE